MRGIGGRALARVRAGRVGALVEPMDRPPQLTAGRLAAQERLVRRLAAMLPAILPTRFGSFAASDAELRRFLRGRDRVFSTALRHVRGAEQMILRLFVEAPAFRPARARSGTAYLAQRAATLSGANVPVLKAIRAALAASRIVRDQRVETHRGAQSPDAVEGTAAPVFSVYHLIPRGRSRAYCNAVLEVVSRASGVAAVVSGPWPPYAFVPNALE